MPIKIAIASGKGGTGKTTVSVSLFFSLIKNSSKNIQLIDCDVEEPNDLLFFDEPSISELWKISQMVPQIDNSKCTYCRKCVEFCEFNAIIVIPPVKYAEVNTGLCHSCGACTKACNFSAISEIPEIIGEVTKYNVGIGKGILEGKLKIGSSMQTMLIKELKKKVDTTADLHIFDAPPGTSCPVVETIADTDYVVLVTEPTPFGLHDLKLTVDLLLDIKKPFGIIVNKAGLGNNKVYEYINKNGFKLLGKIPFSQDFATKYASGSIIHNIPDNIKKAFAIVSKELDKEISGYE